MLTLTGKDFDFLNFLKLYFCVCRSASKSSKFNIKQLLFVVLNRIQHSNFDGEDVKTITGVSIAHPFGIVAYRGLDSSNCPLNLRVYTY